MKRLALVSLLAVAAFGLMSCDAGIANVHGGGVVAVTHPR